MRFGAKMGTIIRNAILNGIDRINTYYQPIVQVWGQMTPAQRLVYLEHSPILKALLDFAKQFEGVD